AVNATTLYVGGDALQTGTSEAQFYSQQVLVRKGGTWTDISVDTNGNSPHTDHHAMAIDSQGNLIDGNDGGVWRLNTANKTWAALNGNLAISPLNGFAPDPTNPHHIRAAGQDNGPELYNGALQADGMPAWSQVDSGDGGLVFFDPLHPNIAYHVINGA